MVSNKDEQNWLTYLTEDLPLGFCECDQSNDVTFFLIDLVIHFIYFFYYTLTIRPIHVTHLIYNSKPKLNPHFHPFEILTIQSPNCLMGTKVSLALKILYKFQMGQLQDQESRRSRKQCKDWCNPLGMKLARAQQSKWV